MTPKETSGHVHEVTKLINNFKLEQNKPITELETQARRLKVALNLDIRTLISKECDKRGINRKIIDNILK